MTPERDAELEALLRHLKDGAKRRVLDPDEVWALAAGELPEHRKQEVLRALGEDRAAILHCSRMRGGNYATAMSGGVKDHADSMSARPRFFKSASTVGSRPRKPLYASAGSRRFPAP